MQALARLRQAGFVPGISPTGGLLIEPASRLTAAQRAYIRAHKVLLVEALRAELAPEPLPPLVPAFDQDAFEERAAILEYDAGFSREVAERRALALMSAENLTKPNIQAPPVESAVAPPLPVARPEQVCCGDCADSILPPDTDPVYGWRLCGLGVDGGGGFGQEVRRCGKSDVNRPLEGHK